jgi:aerobic-type carbon monoxide dehydrogenase small subunit (CoxS/CutS family)
MKKDITVTVNGTVYERTVPLRMLLVDFIRDVVNLTGTHQSCTFEGVCGACTIQLDREAVKSCMMLAVQADGHEITTIEGIGTAENLHPLQQAFEDHHGLQCGFCTSGMIMNAEEFLRVHPQPDEAQIRHALIGNICRCTGYQGIVKAVSAAAEKIGSGSDPSASGV